MRNPFRMITGLTILKNEPLSKHTSFHIGGNADYFVKVYSKKALVGVLNVIKKRRFRYSIIGAGTNVLVSDRGFRGVIIRLDGVFKKIRRKDRYFLCGAGVLINSLLKYAMKSGYGGAEFLAGIPGTVGGAIRGNAGAFGYSIADITDSITVITERSIEKNMMKEEVGFAYRSSRIQKNAIIISVLLRLKKKKRREVMKTINKNLLFRRQRHPSDYSAGSFFKNPPGFSAGKLIEECGLKGLRVGNAEVSTRHANYIINCGQARASDVMGLAAKVKKIVREKKGIVLKEEVKILN
jgi:UDP-N-acetylmuramate dehydrogenase